MSGKAATSLSVNDLPHFLASQPFLLFQVVLRDPDKIKLKIVILHLVILPYARTLRLMSFTNPQQRIHFFRKMVSANPPNSVNEP